MEASSARACITGRRFGSRGSADNGSAGYAGRAPAGVGYVVVMLFALAGAFFAIAAPIRFSLSIAVARLAPAHPEYFGYVVAVGGISALASAALIGHLSDHTRSRLGRRRPFLIVGALAGVVALWVTARATTILVLSAGWAFATIGWGTVIAMLMASQCDRLRAKQRGKVAGLSTVMSQAAPILGLSIGPKLIMDELQMLMIPGAVGAVGVAAFVCLVPEPDNRADTDIAPLTIRSLLRSYLVDPRRDFARIWLGSLMFMVALALNTKYLTFLLSDRIDTGMRQMTNAIEATTIGGLLAATMGAVCGGFLSDKILRRWTVAAIGAVFFSVSAVLMAFAPTVLLVELAALVGNLGLGAFVAVNWAVALDVMPDRSIDAGRYCGIYGTAAPVAQGATPLIAPPLVAIGASAGSENYTLLYLVIAAVAAVAGLMVAIRLRSVP